MRLGDTGLGGGDVGGAGADLGAGGGAGDGDVGESLLVRGDGAGEVGLRLLEGDEVVLGIDLGDDLAGLDLLVVVDVDLDDLAGDARAHLKEVAIDLSVVGALREGRVPVEERADDDEENDDGDDDVFAAGLLGRSFDLVILVALVLAIVATVAALWFAGVALPSVLLDLDRAAGDLGGLGTAVLMLLILVCQGYLPPR